MFQLTEGLKDYYSCTSEVYVAASALFTQLGTFIDTVHTAADGDRPNPYEACYEDPWIDYGELQERILSDLKALWSKRGGMDGRGT